MILYEKSTSKFRSRGRREEYISSDDYSSSSEGDGSYSSSSSDSSYTCSDGAAQTTLVENESQRFPPQRFPSIVSSFVTVNRGNVPWHVNLGGVGVVCGGTIVAMDVSLPLVFIGDYLSFDALSLKTAFRKSLLLLIVFMVKNISELGPLKPGFEKKTLNDNFGRKSAKVLCLPKPEIKPVT